MEYTVTKSGHSKTFPLYVMQADLIGVPQHFELARNGSVDASRLPGDDVK